MFSSWNFNHVNYLLFGIGILVIVIGYLIMITGDTTSFQSVKLAPIILVIGYCVIIPLSIWYKPKNKNT
ncbi:MAG: DUF3098 domain-containing protein [Candidatus Marinimicrobia bacterium]|nr:DUF3098 domain-containing protein [Candidatus Neomarinimicrobiota bacterium]